jgi:hypothetical protein
MVEMRDEDWNVGGEVMSWRNGGGGKKMGGWVQARAEVGVGAGEWLGSRLLTFAKHANTQHWRGTRATG